MNQSTLTGKVFQTVYKNKSTLLQLKCNSTYDNNFFICIVESHRDIIANDFIYNQRSNYAVSNCQNLLGMIHLENFTTIIETTPKLTFFIRFRTII